MSISTTLKVGLCAAIVFALGGCWQNQQPEHVYGSNYSAAE